MFSEEGAPTTQRTHYKHSKCELAFYARVCVLVYASVHVFLCGLTMSIYKILVYEVYVTY